MSAHFSFAGETDLPTRAVVLPVLLSMAAHGLLLAVLLVWPTLRPSRPTLPAVIQVQMVSLKEIGADEMVKALPKAGKTSESTRSVPKAKPKPLKNTPVPEVSIADPAQSAEAPEMKTALKKKTFEPSRAVEQAIERLERSIDERPSPDPLASALDRLKDRVESQGDRREAGAESAPDTPAAQPAGRAGHGGQGREALEQIELYRVDVAIEIERHWAFSESLAGGRTDLMAEVAFSVLPNGEIKDIWFDRRSGNAYLDDSARKAILKANPVRPHPAGLNQPFVVVGLRFTPSGIR